MAPDAPKQPSPQANKATCPYCHTTYARPTGRGRPRVYCSDACRLATTRDIRQLRADIHHYESELDKAKARLAQLVATAPGHTNAEHSDSTRTR